jgi:hypothetical protein
VRVTPEQVEIRARSTQHFQAEVQGSQDQRVAWSVDGGAANGTISPSGLYAAPASISQSREILIRATSVADERSSATARVGLRPLPERLSAVETGILRRSLGMGPLMGKWLYIAFGGLVAQYVHRATDLNRGVLTLTGTLTQVGSDYVYRPDPTDRMIVELENGNRLENIITAFDGNIRQGATAFLLDHRSFQFRIEVLGTQIAASSSTSGSARSTDTSP